MENAKKALEGLKMYKEAIENITEVEEFDLVYNNVVKNRLDNNSIFKLYKDLEESLEELTK